MKLWLAIFLSAVIGISPANRVPPCRVVTGITVQTQSGSAITEQQYTEPEELTLLLDYLRGLKPSQESFGDANPSDRLYLIQVQLSDGTVQSHYQVGIRAYGISAHELHPIDPAQGVDLPLILALLSEDP